MRPAGRGSSWLVTSLAAVGTHIPGDPDYVQTMWPNTSQGAASSVLTAKTCTTSAGCYTEINTHNRDTHFVTGKKKAFFTRTSILLCVVRVGFLKMVKNLHHSTQSVESHTTLTFHQLFLLLFWHIQQIHSSIIVHLVSCFCRPRELKSNNYSLFALVLVSNSEIASSLAAKYSEI